MALHVCISFDVMSFGLILDYSDWRFCQLVYSSHCCSLSEHGLGLLFEVQHTMADARTRLLERLLLLVQRSLTAYLA